MGGENNIEHEEQPAQIARERFEALLPTKYDINHYDGYIETVPDEAQVIIRQEPRRSRNLAGKVLSVIGWPNESYMESSRSAEVGTFPSDDYYVGEMPPRLAINDAFYTPVDPANGAFRVARFTRAIFRTEAMGEADKQPYESGILFRFLSVGKNWDSDETYMRIGLHSVSIHGDKYGSRHMEKYLIAHDLPSLDEAERTDQCVRLADFCIKQAQQPDQ